MSDRRSAPSGAWTDPPRAVFPRTRAEADHEAEAGGRLAARLDAAAQACEVLAYGALAAELGVPMRRLTAALEALMAADVAAGRPLRAALCRARLSPEGLPAPGFFAAARALGLDPGAGPADQAAFAQAQRQAVYDLARVSR
jgi:hypothetical protein